MPTAIIAEDEPILREQLEAKLRKLWPDLEIVASVEDGAAALEALEARAPDFMFLDIQMPEVSGVEVARQVGGRSHVVFVTAYDQYAIQAFETGAVDYILKPATDERLAVTVERLKGTFADNGYYRAKVQPHVVEHADNAEADVTFSIVSGPPAILAGVQFEGQTVYAPVRLGEAAQRAHEQAATITDRYDFEERLSKAVVHHPAAGEPIMEEYD